MCTKMPEKDCLVISWSKPHRNEHVQSTNQKFIQNVQFKIYTLIYGRIDKHSKLCSLIIKRF